MATVSRDFTSCVFGVDGFEDPDCLIELASSAVELGGAAFEMIGGFLEVVDWDIEDFCDAIEVEGLNPLETVGIALEVIFGVIMDPACAMEVVVGISGSDFEVVGDTEMICCGEFETAESDWDRFGWVWEGAVDASNKVLGVGDWVMADISSEIYVLLESVGAWCSVLMATPSLSGWERHLKYH